MTRCRACTATWTGSSAAHCPTCHTTHADIQAFDRHRADGSCARQVQRAGWGVLAFEDTA